MSVWNRFLKNTELRRVTVLALIIFVLYLARGMLSVILLTFIFTFLVLQLVKFVRRFVKVPSAVIVVVIYLLVIYLLYLAVTNYLPVIANQTIKMVNSVYKFYQNPDHDTNQVLRWVNTYIKRSDLVNQFKGGVTVALSYITSVGSMGATFLLSLVLSFFFTVDRDRMYSFSRLFLKSHYAWFFNDIFFFAKKFVNTFGVVIEAQVFIALINTIITTIILAIMKMPQLPSLAIMVFLLSMVPVAGVIISCVPLSLIGYSVGGIRDVAYILIMILVVHMLETYVLNPQFMSSRTKLPVFYTFVVLMIGEWVFGTWGLIVGIPIFTFLLDILGVKSISENTQTIAEENPPEKGKHV
ncbi:AI-2E family transporter [Loigolactobacillus backii]|uniref:AI-2E family transporter n=1 Tax=Loigolactobacillus backii TaxID=375175 RepID=A0A192GY69_9LACO|nr:AI-2E family transporter [Loigolactobacillus backii]ANK61459.1 AI-2E family transporter [Loigolactobacillus backii]ANK69342.1 AI-2E family transporter [Loigolactobacillus backii]MDA5387800.1 AI-2E family transporter [Loigolactobacillus backii]MDA5390870.1 AI-2E family transporter [Loigolactobacillus backii]